MAPKNSGAQDDRDWLYLETTGSHAIGIKYAALNIEQLTDDPKILEQLGIIFSSAQLIQNLHRDYRPRIGQLKQIEKERAPRGKGAKNNVVSNANAEC